MGTVTCVAPVNIAVIKYWGKRDEDLILPLNDSISSTLSSDYMCAKTTVMASPSFTESRFWLNGKEEGFDNPRLSCCLRELKKRAKLELSDITKWHIHVCSENNFPTAAGLASSAAGYACLVYALANLYGVQGDVSALARLGSGSACRSVLGGWVQWHAGISKDGTDSFATQIAPASHWPEMRILILVVSDNRKKHSSTAGMKRSVATSAFLKYRAESVVPKRTEEMIKAIKEKNFARFADLTMKDSNQFHSVCLDTFPPCTYMNDVSHAIIELVHAYNDFRGSSKVAYTFDAGPNACLYMLEEDVEEVLSLIRNVFPCSTDPLEYVKGIPVQQRALSEELYTTIHLTKQKPGVLKYIIHTNVGDGPEILKDENEHLLTATGQPDSLV